MKTHAVMNSSYSLGMLWIIWEDVCKVFRAVLGT